MTWLQRRCGGQDYLERTVGAGRSRRERWKNQYRGHVDRVTINTEIYYSRKGPGLVRFVYKTESEIENELCVILLLLLLIIIIIISHERHVSFFNVFPLQSSALMPSVSPIRSAILRWKCDVTSRDTPSSCFFSFLNSKGPREWSTGSRINNNNNNNNSNKNNTIIASYAHVSTKCFWALCKIYSRVYNKPVKIVQ